MWMHFFPCQEVNWFIVVFRYAFCHSVSAWNVCKWDCLHRFHFSIWFSGFLRFTNVNWYAQLIRSKVMITEIVEGPYSINNIDLYSNYSGNNIVSLNLSFLVLTCKAILWQKSNLSNRKDSCSMFVMNLRYCLNLRFYLFFVCKQLFGFFQLGNEPDSLQLFSGILKSKNFTSLHHHWSNTVHNFRTRDVSVSKHSKV